MNGSESYSETPDIKRAQRQFLSMPLSRQVEVMKHLEHLKRIVRWRQDPIAYMVERLGVKRESLDWLSVPGYEKHEWDGDVNPFMSVAQSLAQWRWVAVESATSTGKTYFGAGLVLWFLECFEDSLVITAAPKETQLRLHIWKEVGSLYQNFGMGELMVGQLRMEPYRDKWTAVAFVAGVNAEEVNRSATRAQGFHAEHMLIILEETPGIAGAVISAFANTSVAPHNLIVAFGNPDHQLDNLHAFTKLSRVDAYRISAFDHPNVVTGNPNLVPGATSELGIQGLLERYGGENNPLYLSRARGISPSSDPDSLIRIEWCYSARDRGRVIHGVMEGVPALGVDVANSAKGDKASMAFGIGTALVSVESFPCPSSNKLGDQVALFARDKSIAEENIGVDSIGVGAGCWNQLNEQHGLKTNPLNTGPDKGAEIVEQFVSLRSQMWWQMREDLRTGVVSLPDDPELFADLVTPKWKTSGGKIYVEAKEEVKKRLSRSPDKGDSAVYWNWVRRARTSASAQLTDNAEQQRPGVKTDSPFAAPRRRTF